MTAALVQSLRRRRSRSSVKWPRSSRIEMPARNQYGEGEGAIMDLRLSHDEAHILHGLLHDYLPELKFETARTGAGDLRHVLVERRLLCERLLKELSDVPARV
jgi:hypothetical protein